MNEEELICLKCGHGIYRECNENDTEYLQCDYCGEKEE